jgi:regulatory protein
MANVQILTRLWHKRGVVRTFRGNDGKARVRPIADGAALEALALRYVGRYATTRAKLRAYLRRKIDERGWGGEGAAPVEDVVARCATLGYVDDAAFATARGAALARRGYGAARVGLALRAAGVEEEDAAPVREAAVEEGWEAALRFARRKRIGPFADAPATPDQRRRHFAAMLRAGHAMDVVRKIIDAEPGSIVSPA